MHRSSPLLAGVLAVAALACAAPAALADSIAYIKDGNVWLTTPDGGRQYQVTASGGYSDVSQADDGTMIALKGVRLNKLARDGQVLADFDTPVSDTRAAPAKTFYGPYDPAISPDGTKVAYTYYFMTQGTSPSCQPPTCFTTINEGGTGYSFSDRQTAWDVPGLGKHSGWRYPAWVDNDTTLLADPTHLPNNDVILDTLSDGTSGNLVHNWFSDLVGGNPHVSGGDITRDRTKLAFATGAQDSTLTVYWVPQFPTTFKDGDAPAGTKPHPCYRYSDPTGGGSFSQPSFAPSGAAMVFASGDGIHVAQVPAFAGDCTLNGATNDPPLLIAGATQPDWGPADVPAPRIGTTTPPPPPPTTTTRPAPALTPAVAKTPAALSVKVVKAAGHRLTIAVQAPGKGKLTAKAKGATASKTVAKAGTVKLTLKVRGSARKATIKVTFKAASGETLSGSAKS